MSWSNQERINATAKALLGGVLDADPATQWYEGRQPFSFVVANRQVWSEGATVKLNPAANIPAAQANCAGPLLGIVDDLSAPASSIRLTPVAGMNNTFVALSVYGDFSSAQLDNWVKPQFAPQASGSPSYGYAIRLFNGDPNAGGIEIMTSDGLTGSGATASVGWVWNYDNGLLLLASDFIVPDPWVLGFRYIGANPASPVIVENKIVWAPGALFGGAVVNTWLQVMAALALIPGFVDIHVDDTLGALTIPAGVYDLQGRARFIRVVQSFGENPAPITMADGAVVQNLSEINGQLQLIGQGTVLAALVFTLPGPHGILLREGANLTNNGSVPMIESAAGDSVGLGLVQEASLSNGSAPVLHVDATSTAILTAMTGSAIDTQAISSDVGAVVTRLHDASLVLVAPWPLALGTTTDQWVDHAKELGYDDALFDPDLGFTTAQQIIDELKLGGPRMTTIDRLALAAPTPGLRIYDTTLNKIFYWDGAAWVQLGGGGGSIIWDAAKTWAQVLAELVQNNGGIVLVPADSAKEMTPDVGPTNLDNVVFIGLTDGSSAKPQIDIDSLAVGGFVLGGGHNLTSKDIDWVCYYKIGTGKTPTWTFDGGSFTCANPASAYQGLVVYLNLRNGAITDGTACTTAVFEVVNTAAVVTMFNGSTMGLKTFHTNKGVPVFPIKPVTRDAGSTWPVGAYVGTFVGSDTLVDLAVGVSYDGTLEPPIAVSNVQDGLDELKRGGPRMTTLARLAIAVPTAGMRVYDTDLNAIFYYDGAAWIRIGTDPATGDPNTVAFFDPAGDMTDDVGLTVLPVDGSGRPQLRDIRLGALSEGAVWHQGSWQFVGDAADVEGEGLYLYGKSINGVQSPAEGAYARVKKDQFGLLQVIPAVPAGFFMFNADESGLYLKDNTDAKTFEVDRLTGAVRALRMGVGAAPNDASAAAQVDSTTQGFLPPRMTNVERAAIVAPATGLVVFCTDAPVGLYYYDGAAWVQLGAAGAVLSVYDEGLLVSATVGALNFIGADVLALYPGVPAGQANIYIPPPTYLSHWNTADGSNGNQAVTESIARAVAHISTPSGGEGTPFKTNGWAGTNQSATLNGVVTNTTPNDTSGFGGDSTMTVTLYDANGVGVLETYTTPAITADAVHTSPSGFIAVTITNYGVDALRFKAHASVAVNCLGILGAAGLSGGRVHVLARHTTDSITDGSGPYDYTQADVFIDTNPTTPVISTDCTIAETIGSIVTKHLSGLEYYILTSQFTVDVTGLDQLNRNTSRTSNNLVLVGTEFGLPQLNTCPFGAMSGNYIGWTNDEDTDNVQFLYTAWAITAANYRYCGPTCNVTGQPADTWAAGAVFPSADHLVLIDTWLANATALAEYFNDEARREDPASFPGVGTWVSTNTLLAGEAMVYGGLLQVPSSTVYIRSDGAATPNANWTLYKPDLGGANPNYTLLTAPSSYGRRFTKAPGLIPSMSIVFAGTFAAGNALADLVAGNIEIYVYRIGGLGTIGPPPGNTRPLRVHVPFSFALYDDGLTVPGSGIREGSSAGNTINATFGTGTPADGGFYCRVVILNPATKIDSMVVTFF